MGVPEASVRCSSVSSGRLQVMKHQVSLMPKPLSMVPNTVSARRAIAAEDFIPDGHVLSRIDSLR